MSPLAAGGTFNAAGAGEKDSLRKEEKKQVKRKQLRSFLHVSSGLHHLSTPEVGAHLATLCSYICKK